MDFVDYVDENSFGNISPAFVHVNIVSCCNMRHTFGNQLMVRNSFPICQIFLQFGL